MLPEVRMARVLDAIRSHRGGRLSCVEDGVIDRRRGRVSSTRVPDAEAEWLAKMFRTRYFDFTAKHFHEQVVGQPMAGGKPFHRSYSCVKRVLQLRGLTTKAPRRGVHRRKRERRPLPGMMLFQDGSKHAWLGEGSDLDLIVTMDDATSAITSIFLCEEEGTASSFRGLSETIRAHGVLHRPGQPLLLHAEGGREGRQDASDAGGAGAEATAHRAHPLLQSAGAGADRAALGHVAEAPASAAENERDHDDRGGQSLAGGGLYRATQRPL